MADSVSMNKLVAKMQEILRKGNLDELTPRVVLEQLSSHFGVDVSSRKKEIKAELGRLIEEIEEEEGGEEEESDDEKNDHDDADSGSDRDTQRQQLKDLIKKAAPSPSGKGKPVTKPKETKGAKPKRSGGGGGGGGFAKPVPLSAALADFVGAQELGRSEVVKKMWEYIKSNELQDPNDKRTIVCDDKLRDLLGVESCTAFSINKYLSPHFPPSEGKSSSTPAKKSAPKKKRSRSDDEDLENGESEEGAKKKKRGGGGFAAPLLLSDTMADFLGESTLARTEVVKRIWAYVKENELQDPSDKRKIICDDKLRTAFKGAKKFSMFEMNKLLQKHLFKPEDI